MPRKVQDQIAPDLLRALLHYEPETGKLFWKRRDVDCFEGGSQTAEHNCAIWNGKYAGREAFTAIGNHGYRSGSLFGKAVLAHRVIWAMQTGAWPDQVDHDDRDKMNNAWSNLKDTDNSGNQRNKGVSRNSTSGVLGVSWNKKAKKWSAQISIGGKSIYLGLHDTLEAAKAARAVASATHGFHANHGGQGAAQN